jgi:hypothetical protein
MSFVPESLIASIAASLPAADDPSIAARGVKAAAAAWTERDGSLEEFQAFCAEHWTHGPDARQALLSRLERSLEAIFGHAGAASRVCSWGMDVDEGPIHPVDRLLAEYSPHAHIVADLFERKVAFSALLNFPPKLADELDREGERLSRREWAEARVAAPFADRLPSELLVKLAEAQTRASEYVSTYNLYPARLTIDGKAGRFDEGKRLLSHWNLRDEIRALYSAHDSLPKQRAIAKAMARIVDGTVPAECVDSDAFDWDPETGRVGNKGGALAEPERLEGPRRWEHVLALFRAERDLDPHCPAAPSFIDRRFLIGREMSEGRVEALLASVLSSPVAAKVAELARSRLGRDLEPFDIWYASFDSDAKKKNEGELDAICRSRYPNAKAFKAGIVDFLERLGFSGEKALWLSERIDVDPARGSGHASGGSMRGEKARLRTRIAATGMDYKGYNIAAHELGHNVEQTFSLEGVDYASLQGVPNTAFTEAFAFVFQARDLFALGLAAEPEESPLKVAGDFWATFEISGVALVDMRIWRWMYAHPDADAEALKEAALAIAKDVWNLYFAPAIGVRDSTLLAIYSHIVDSELYIPDYPMGHLICFQIEEFLKGRNLAKEMERMCTLGRLTPDEWMRRATGSPVSAESLIAATKEALAKLGRA